MSPVLDRMNHDAIAPYMSEQITAQQAIELGTKPLREFMVSQTRESDLRAVIEMAKAPQPKTMEEIRFGHLVTVVVAALMALGMTMLPPTTISLPLKILLFILIDGWVLLSKALLGSYWN
ncbi:hypothetical protein [Stenotrophomonas sp. 22385]|uniref:hypothetical protein n=1 Tax=Stenotrophomonas sp. 22385 TaxID=3453915 RepID=UPI003F836411